MKKGTSERSCKAFRSLLIVLVLLLVLLVAAPVQAKAAADDQYEGRTGVGHDAADDAVTASEAFDEAEVNSSEESTPSAAAEGPPAPDEPGTATAREIAEAATSVSKADIALKSLPDTGGISPLLLGVLLVAAGLLMRYVARWALRTQ